MNSSSFGSITAPMGVARARTGMPRISMGRGRGTGVPSLGGLGIMKLAGGGLAEGGHPSMSWLAVRDTLRGMPNHTVPDYMLARMADGGNVSAVAGRRAMRAGFMPHASGFPHMADGGGREEMIQQMRRRHGRLGGFRGLDASSSPMRTMLENDPESWYDSDVPNQLALYRAMNARRGMSMSPDIANGITQGAIDNVHGPSTGRQMLEMLLGDSPASVSMLFGNKGFLPHPRMGGLAAMLSSDDAGAASDEMQPRDYQGYGKYQPFRGVQEPIR